MIRWTFHIMLCLLLGVVTTVSVAEYSILVQHIVSTPPASVGIITEDSLEGWNKYAVAGWDPPVDQLYMSGSIYSNIGLVSASPGQVPSLKWMSIYSTGWPCRARQQITVDGFDQNRSVMVNRTIDRLIFPGFFFDTLFYGTIWFALLFGLRAHMRVIRRWQGHCPMCKYDLRGDLETGCPECGWNRDRKSGMINDGHPPISTTFVRLRRRPRRSGPFQSHPDESLGEEFESD